MSDENKKDGEAEAKETKRPAHDRMAGASLVLMLAYSRASQLYEEDAALLAAVAVGMSARDHLLSHHPGLSEELRKVEQGVEDVERRAKVAEPTA